MTRPELPPVPYSDIQWSPEDGDWVRTAIPPPWRPVRRHDGSSAVARPCRFLLVDDPRHTFEAHYLISRDDTPWLSSRTGGATWAVAFRMSHAVDINPGLNGRFKLMIIFPETPLRWLRGTGRIDWGHSVHHYYRPTDGARLVDFEIEGTDSPEYLIPRYDVHC